MSDKAGLLTEHYQKTYELTYEHWKQRNRVFLMLLAVIGGATLLTFQVQEAQSLLVDFVAKTFGISESNRVQELKKSFPFGILQSILLLVVFYLMVNLYHRAITVLRNYRYLGELENEIRAELTMVNPTVGFTREGSFYWGGRVKMLGVVKWIYITLLGLLLLAFLGGRIVDDFRTDNTVLGLIDILIATPTLIFFYAYATSSVSFDKSCGEENPGKRKKASRRTQPAGEDDHE